ncbi:MAG: hypothetical protein COB29_01040 [Sulfitobacter sp.]|nr:MAG: hypothetical protein COB29_01040 [Sulfitobacter sp.]
MSKIVPFLFEDAQLIRSLEKNGNPWFVVVDVCKAMDVKNTSDVIARLDEDEKAEVDLIVGRQKRSLAIINESGLYSLIMSSRKPAAKRVKKWVTSEVLPAIRKTGRYERTASVEEVEIDTGYVGQLERDLLEKQSELIALYRYKDEIGKLSGKNNKNLAYKLFQKTNLTDFEIAGILEDVLGNYLPEWVAYQRRCYKGGKPDLHLVD